MSANADLEFPQDCIVGSLGEFAREMAKGTEVPEEFYFAAGLTLLGATLVGDVSLNASVDPESRLYTLLLGESADVKKSTAMVQSIRFFKEKVWRDVAACPVVNNGVGSAEGLGLALKDSQSRGVILCYDELSTFVQKAQIQSSVLLPMTATLFEGTQFQNRTKTTNVTVDDGHLTILGCCTTDTYEAMWMPDAIRIGFPNRLLIVWADRKVKVVWPEPRDEQRLQEIGNRIVMQLPRVPLKLSIELDAKMEWQRWYDALPPSVHAKRLDTIGMRLFKIMAVTMDKTTVDLELVRLVIRILDYELRVREVTDPIDATSTIARMEQKITRQLESRGTLDKGQLRRHTHASRDGLWCFEAALKNLLEAGLILALKGTHAGQFASKPGPDPLAPKSAPPSISGLTQ